MVSGFLDDGCQYTFILANIFEGKGQTRILSLNNTNLAKGTFAHDPQKPKMIEIDCNNV